jgi:membrane fusion protein, multidrug efflux system
MRIRCLPLVLVLAWPACKKSDAVVQLPQSGATTKRSVRTVIVRADVTTDVISATGTTAALSTTKIMPLVTGLITTLPVKEGDTVKRGQVLAVLDQRGYRLSVAQAEAAIGAARVAVDATTREHERFKRLMQQDATAKAQYDQVLDRLHGAQAAMKQAQVARDMARKALGDTVVRAPYAGVITKKLASVGDYATAMPPTVILAMMDIHALELKVALPEPELQRVEENARITAKLTSNERTVTTKISRIIRSVDPMTRSFEIIAEIPNDDLSLKPGVFADVKITTSKPRRRLLLPTAAVVDEGGGVLAVFLAQASVARRVEVKAAVASQEETEILSGLNGGEEVVLDASGLMDGDTIDAKPLKKNGVGLAAEEPKERNEAAQ